MILVDSTIVSVATPALMDAFDASINEVMWVTSSYLLAYAVPLLITGRLGDRVGPRPVYLVGLTVFTLASLWCGLTGDLGLGIGALITARAVQGLGASMMTPQTMAVITRTFPAERRGSAMALWGATAGVATLVGPLLGGVLIDGLGWEWIFFVNVPVGVLGLLLAVRLVPRLETHAHRFDLVGVVLSAVGLFCLVFGIQEGQNYDWGAITGFVSVPLLIITGAVLMVAFVVWQAVTRGEPLVPLRLFGDRNFSMANIAITATGFTVVAMIFPVMIWAQGVRGLSPTMAALLLAPSSVMSFALAPLAGRLTDRVHPRLLVGGGTLALAVGLVMMSRAMTPDAPLWHVLAAQFVLGLASPFIWGPLSTAATRNLPPQRAGAGAGVYNTTRQIGSVLGSAAISVLMEARLAARLGGAPGAPAPGTGEGMTGGAQMPPLVAEQFSRALSESMFLPAAVILVGLLAALFFELPRHMAEQRQGRQGRRHERGRHART
ncbi:DHA2 family efflux MFS transporter permease subunit [Ornithinimicrobium avium]|uniref:MFS transporter n=1 Tax=Ornithinimicrobium avium TaxID=2283195 RepID=A0A345NSB9_9MICO|nr:DHA2 family efflux MFS transporter permease subunit [Ornithinimicrobium avium]AXH97927.1 MFS transporter [Ornithinimicrobium avium]